jgi:hypothetical protein
MISRGIVGSMTLLLLNIIASRFLQMVQLNDKRIHRDFRVRFY